MKKQRRIPPDIHQNIFMLVRSRKRVDRKLRQRARAWARAR